MPAPADGTIGRRIRSPLRLTGVDITPRVRWKAGCKGRSCAMRCNGAQDASFMTTDEHETTPAFGEALEFLDSDKHDETLVAVGRAHQFDHARAPAYARRAAAWQDKGDTRHALADCDAAISLDPRNASYHRLRGKLRHMQADLDGALADFDA